MLSKPSINIVATILAKNEADIIGHQIEHHLEHGVSHIIFTDNNSSDLTREIAAKYPEVREIIVEEGNDHNQSLWVSRMAQIACKFKPHWIIHLDADEFWCGLGALKRFDCEIVGCERMYFHPPAGTEFNFDHMSHYLDLDHLPLPQECKVAHRPIPDIMITHGNHGTVGLYRQKFTSDVYRHHYPIRSYKQWEMKAKLGHESLQRRGAICKRWERWHSLLAEGQLEAEFSRLVNIWNSMINTGSDQAQFLSLLRSWCEPEVVALFEEHGWIPKIQNWKNNG